ncbi:MAG: hypothetical protein M0Z41_17860 [Peptococcaceae bacterium]|nr:hypothetical protein [Peptococcaceae bacterium]
MKEADAKTKKGRLLLLSSAGDTGFGAGDQYANRTISGITRPEAAGDRGLKEGSRKNSDFFRGDLRT